MKYTYIHNPMDSSLICVETLDIVPIELPPLEPVATYAERLEEEERKAKERYEMMKAKMNEELTPLEAFENIIVDLTPYLKKANDKEIKIVKNALERLDKIETTTHSVLREDISNKLKALEIIKEIIEIFPETSRKMIDWVSKEKQDLLKEVLS